MKRLGTIITTAVMFFGVVAPALAHASERVSYNGVRYSSNSSISSQVAKISFARSSMAIERYLQRMRSSQSSGLSSLNYATVNRNEARNW